jgi:hypothetical protein
MQLVWRFGGRHQWATVIRDFETRSPQQKDLPPDPARREISDGPDQAFAYGQPSHPWRRRRVSSRRSDDR